jgi:hypothetical protein
MDFLLFVRDFYYTQQVARIRLVMEALRLQQQTVSSPRRVGG